jgi:hypothetical protein
MVISDSKVVASVRSTFGGSRIIGGQSSADLWSDGVILGAAWSTADETLGGQLFSFRGELSRARLSSRPSWRLVETGFGYVDNYPTRKAALEAVQRECQMRAFRELNRVESAR